MEEEDGSDCCRKKKTRRVSAMGDGDLERTKRKKERNVVDERFDLDLDAPHFIGWNLRF